MGQTENRLKLLQVTTIPITLTSFLFPFVEYFHKQGWIIDAMANNVSRCNECIEKFDNVWDVAWSRNPLDPRNLLKASRQVRKIVLSEQYDIVHVHTPVAAFVTRYALKNIRRESKKPKVIYTAHGFHFYPAGTPLKNFIFRNLEKLAGNWTDHLVVINRDDEVAARRFGLVQEERIHYIPGIGVDTTYYSPSNVSDDEILDVRRELGLSTAESLILMVAGFDHGKRHRDILNAFARVERTDVHLAFAGVGPTYKKIQKLAFDMGVAKRVHFLGRRNDIPILIKASIATCLPSEREGLARSVMESFCLGVPVIGSDARGVRDLLEENNNILVKVGDVDGFADAIVWVIEHPEQAKKIGRAGRIRMSKYDVQHILRMYEDIYKKALFA